MVMRRCGTGVAKKVELCREDDRSRPVRNWTEGLPKDIRDKVIARIDPLKQGGPTV